MHTKSNIGVRSATRGTVARRESDPPPPHVEIWLYKGQGELSISGPSRGPGTEPVSVECEDASCICHASVRFSENPNDPKMQDEYKQALADLQNAIDSGAPLPKGYVVHHHAPAGKQLAPRGLEELLKMLLAGPPPDPFDDPKKPPPTAH